MDWLTWFTCIGIVMLIQWYTVAMKWEPKDKIDRWVQPIWSLFLLCLSAFLLYKLIKGW